MEIWLDFRAGVEKAFRPERRCVVRARDGAFISPLSVAQWEEHPSLGTGDPAPQSGIVSLAMLGIKQWVFDRSNDQTQKRPVLLGSTLSLLWSAVGQLSQLPVVFLVARRLAFPPNLGFF